MSKQLLEGVASALLHAYWVEAASATHLKDVAYRLTVVGEKVDTRGYERVISNRQQVRLRATLAKPAYVPAD